ncbi:MAG: translocation/assembly module TamB domain-containing protein [Leadbetterella sp.]|nr:translocation/assembly module TamB domain-containing protein [Leadbetterella sp.]
MKRIASIVIRILSYAFMGAFFILFIAFYALQLPEVQTQLSHNAMDWLSERLGGNISVSKVRISWFDKIVLEDLNIKDNQDRNMIFVREVYVDARTNLNLSLRSAFEYDKKVGWRSLKFQPGKIIRFDNNLDFVTLNNPEARFIRDRKGMLNFDYWLLEIDKLTKKKKDGKKPVKPFTLDNVDIKDGIISIVTEHSRRHTDGTFDFANFEFRDLNARLEKLSFKRDTILLVSKNLSAKDGFSELEIRNATGRFFHCRKGIRLDNLHAQLNDSQLQDRLYFSYSRPSDFGDFFHKVHIDADMRNSVLQAKDIGLFIPVMKNYKEEYRVTTRLNGTVASLQLKDMTLDFGKGSHIRGNGKLTGLPDLKTTHSVLDLEPSVLLARDVAQYSAHENFQKYIAKVERLDFSGTFNGVYNDFQSRPRLVSPRLGEIVGEVNVKAKGQLEYSGNLVVNQFKIGDFLENNQLDEITFHGKINGLGRELEEARVHLDGHVSAIDFKGYRYRNIAVDGNLGQSLFDGKLNIDDPNILADIEGKIDFNQEVNAFNIEGYVGYANLKTLGFTTRDFMLRSRLNFDFKGNRLDDWLGEASFSDFELREQDKILKVDSMYFFSDLIGKERSFKIESEFFNAGIRGNFVPSRLLMDVSDFVSEHRMYFETTEDERSAYYTRKKDTRDYSTESYRSAFNVRFNRPAPFFDFFAPAVYVSKNAEINGSYEAGLTSTLQIAGNTDTLSVKGNEFYATFFDYYAQKEILSPTVVNKIRIKSDKQKTGNNVLTEELVVNANWEGTNTIDFRTFITQNNSGSLIDLRGKLDFFREGFSLRLLPDQTVVRLIDMDWAFAPDNRIDFRKRHITFNNFNIRGGTSQYIGLNGVMSSNPADALTLEVNEFDIENLLPFVNVDLRGTATGNLRLQNFYTTNPLYVSNLHVTDFYYKKSLVGTVTTSALWDESRDRLRLEGSVFRNMEEILKLEGFFTPGKGNKGLELEGALRNADMDMFLGMTGDVFSELKGKANGAFKVSGTPRRPVFDGEVEITGGSLKVAVSGTSLYFEDKILLNSRGFVLPAAGVEVRDAPGGNTARLTGGVYYRSTPGFTIDLKADINSRSGFKIMDIPAFSNDYIFGTAYVNGDVNLSGDFDNLVVSGNLSSRDGTAITIPTDSDTKIDTQQEGIPFLKKPVRVDSSALRPNKRRLPAVKTGGVRLAFNLTLTPEAQGEIIFDRANNDVLSLYGDGRLSVLYDSRGEFTINGPYNVRGGKYFFSFQNLASLRRFDITDNSKITFNGDPLQAILDIKATYTANISLNKVSPQMTNSSARFPVYVNVFLADRLLTPTIRYDIAFDLKQIPISGQTDILAFEQRLSNDEQLLSRNVSSILVFNEVFPDNNLADALTQQFLIDNISSLLSNQIGNLANKLNPNLEFGVRFGDFRENLLNNMQLDFSYKFLNNRVKLSGKGAFVNSLENSISLNTNTYGQLSVGGELEYLISDDGAYRFKLYSRSVPTNYYVFYSQGNVVVSGGSLIISRNFNSFFRKKNNGSIPLGVGSGGGKDD